MIALWIFLWILLGLFIILCCPLTLSVAYLEDEASKATAEALPAKLKYSVPGKQTPSQPMQRDGESTEDFITRLVEEAKEVSSKPPNQLKVRLSFLIFRFTLYPMKPGRTPKKAKEFKEPKEPKFKKKTEKTQDTEEQKLEDLLEMVKPLLKAGLRALKMVGRDILIHHVRLRVLVANEDAAKTAVNYGRANTIIFGGFALADNYMRIKRREVLISPDFSGSQEATELSGSLRVTIHPVVPLCAALLLAVAFLREFLKKKGRSSK